MYFVLTQKSCGSKYLTRTDVDSKALESSEENIYIYSALYKGYNGVISSWGYSI